MSNIFTEFARLYLRPGVLFTPIELEPLCKRILDERGSYWVPIWYAISPYGYVDVQYGSGKGAGLHNLEPDDLAPFEEIWVRFADSGADCDVIEEWAPELGESAYDGYRRRRPCHYAFDEVRIRGMDRAIEGRLSPELSWVRTDEGSQAACAGSYLALNDRIDMAVGPGARFGIDTKRTPGGLPTPTTPCHGSAPIGAVEPGELGKLLQEGGQGIERVELRFAGRVVHRAAWGHRYERANKDAWISLCADDWDNCVDEDFVRLRGGAARPPSRAKR